MGKKKLAFAGLGVAVLSASFMVTPSASAAEARNGVCESGEFCLYYNSDHGGSMIDLAFGDKNYGAGDSCTAFKTAGAGQGQCVKNNTASVWNRESSVVTVFYKSDWAGAVDSIPSGGKVNLSSTLKNNNAGHVVGEVGNDNLQFGLYQEGGGRISSYFDGYLSTSGRHEGIDLVKGFGEPVYSLTAGQVTNKVEGDSNSLSTIAIYNADLDKTVIYLHTDPLNTLAVGQSVSRGQKIATEAARAAGSTHTHVEMRPGKQLRASKSVDDYTLDNPIPTEFWMNRGYNICCS